MGWKDPHNPWSKAQSQRVRLCLINVLLNIVLVPGIVLAIYFILRRSSTWTGEMLLGVLSGWWWLWAAAILLPAGACFWRWKIETRIQRLIPLHDGLVCPFCRRPLTVGGEDSPCPSCKRRYPAEAVQRYWEAYAFDPRGTLVQLRQLEANASARGGRGLRQWRHWMAAHPAFIILLVVLWLVLCSTVIALYQGRSILGQCLEFTPFLFLMSSIMLIAWGWRHRAGDELFCAKCGYQFAPHGINPDRCPECGMAWLQPGSTVRGRRVRTRWMIALGCFLFMAYCGSMFSSRFSWRGPASRLLPTGSLIREASRPYSGSMMEPWTALQKRSLSPEQTRELAEGLLASRLSSRWLSPEAEKWFTAMIAAKQLPPELIERYYREMLDVALVVPALAKVGQTFQVRLASAPRYNLHSSTTLADDMAVYFSGYFVDDSAEPLARPSQFIFCGLMDDKRYAPTAEISVDEPGPCRIRAVLWLIAGRGPAIYRAAPVWLPDNSPVLPPGTSWSKRVELEKTVDVAP